MAFSLRLLSCLVKELKGPPARQWSLSIDLGSPIGSYTIEALLLRTLSLMVDGKSDWTIICLIVLLDWRYDFS